jgi:phospholipase/carboxylesterase
MRRHRLVAQWSVPDEAAAAGRDVLVLLHGYGTDEQGLYEQATSAVNAEVVIVSLKGPVAEGGGYAWVPMETSLATVTPDAIAAVARERAQPVLDWLDMLPPTRSIGLLGVSQGAVVALHLLRLAPTRFSYAINLSGYVLAGEEIGDATLRRERPPVFWGRGRDDQVIPPSYVERTQDWLPRHSGLTSHVYPIGHEESPEEFADVATFVSSVTRGYLPPASTHPTRRAP